MTTIEARPDFFAAARTVLNKYRNIEQVLGDSSKVLVKRAARFFNGVPFLFLDAHWENCRCSTKFAAWRATRPTR